MQAQFWRTRRGRGCHPFFPFSVVFHHFISFVILLYELQMKKPVRVKRRLRTVVFTVQEAFTLRHQNSNQETIDSSEFLPHEVLQHLKNLYLHKYPRVPPLLPLSKAKPETTQNASVTSSFPA